MNQNPQVVFIEGQEANGVKLFISRLNDYFRAEGDYAKIINQEQYNSLQGRKRKIARQVAFSSANRNKKEIYFWNLLKKHGLPFSFRSLDLGCGSPENRVLINKIQTSSIDKNVNLPAELLQAHFDYHNTVEEFKSSHDLLMCEKGPMSYYVDIIKGRQRDDLLAPFEQFMDKLAIETDPVWILQAPVSQTKERHLLLTGEDKPIEYFEQIQQHYQDAANSGFWKNVSFIDASSDNPDNYRTIFASLGLSR
jgi:hypothetical protein